jgi:hypothetical protein
MEPVGSKLCTSSVTSSGQGSLNYVDTFTSESTKKIPKSRSLSSVFNRVSEKNVGNRNLSNRENNTYVKRLLWGIMRESLPSPRAGLQRDLAGRLKC